MAAEHRTHRTPVSTRAAPVCQAAMSYNPPIGTDRVVQPSDDAAVSGLGLLRKRSWLTASASDRSGCVLVALLCCLGLEADASVLRMVAVDRARDMEGDRMAGSGVPGEGLVAECGG